MTTQAPGAPTDTQHFDPRPRHHTGRWLLVFLIGIGAIAVAMYYSGAFQHKPRIAIVTASSGPFWDQIVRGANDAGAVASADVRIIRAGGDENSQSQAIKGLVGQGYDGVGVSPNDPMHQAADLSDLAGECPLITYDAD